MKERRSLLSSKARIQAPFIKVTIGNFTFGVFTKEVQNKKDSNGFYRAVNIQYPNYVQSLSITKTNGQVNTYTLQLEYPIGMYDDPNFFEKVFSSVSNSRKIIFSYGDSSTPNFIYKDEEAIITKVTSSFNVGSKSSISYTVYATSNCALGLSGCYTFMGGLKKPSDEIKKIFSDKSYGLQSLFTGMTTSKLSEFIAGDDKAVRIEGKTNISILEYISYLVSCMTPAGSTEDSISKDIYILTIHDQVDYDDLYDDGTNISGTYFKVTRTSYKTEHADAYTIDIGYNDKSSNTLVTNFLTSNSENYSLYYNYQQKLVPDQYTKRLNNQGQWEDVFAPTITSKNNNYLTRTEDVSWWTKITQYPITASITIQGLLRPALLMTYVRLNVYFPGISGGGAEEGNGTRRHISSGLYIVTGQQDSINSSGYKTTLSLTKISG